MIGALDIHVRAVLPHDILTCLTWWIQLQGGREHVSIQEYRKGYLILITIFIMGTEKTKYNFYFTYRERETLRICYLLSHTRVN